MNYGVSDFIVCPKCGYEDRDSWEVDFGPGLEGDRVVQCGACEFEFYVTRHCDVSYSTAPVGKAVP